MTQTAYKMAFIKKHNKADWNVETSPMDEDGTYRKTYVFSDGAVLYEVNRPVWEDLTMQGEVRGIKFTKLTHVKLLETEMWNSDDPKSVKWYETF